MKPVIDYWINRPSAPPCRARLVLVDSVFVLFGRAAEKILHFLYSIYNFRLILDSFEVIFSFPQKIYPKMRIYNIEKIIPYIRMRLYISTKKTLVFTPPPLY